MTELKKGLISASRSEAQQEIADLCEAIVNDKLSVSLALKEIVSWVRTQVAGRVYDSDHELKKTCLEFGFKVFEKRLKVGSTMQYILLSPDLVDAIKRDGLDNEQIASEVRKKMKSPVELSQSSM
jgi:hypothetical protein